jgi:hypothetical protein
MKTVRLSLMFWALSALAQFPFPGQGPGGYPGGGYPGGYPGGRRAPQQQPQQQQQPQNSRGRSNRAVTSTTDGMLRRVSGNQLIIEADDHRVIWYRITSQTASLKDGRTTDAASFQPGDRLSVEASEDDDGNFTATSIDWERAGSISERAAAQETWDLPGPGSLQASSNPRSSRRDTVGDTGDDDRPILRRKNDDSSTPAPAAPSSPPAPPQAPTAARPPAATTQNSSQNSSPDSDDDSAYARPATQVATAAPPDADDPGRPVLRRGGAASARQPVTSAPPVGTPPAGQASASTSASNGQATGSSNPALVGRSSDAATRAPSSQPIQQEDPLIGKVREAAFAFSSLLPNFMCQQITTRYGSQNPRQGWDTIDVVTADVAYQNGQESYRNIKATGKSTVQSMDQLEGTRSTGEFSSMLQDLMSEATGAVFHRNGTDSIHGRTAIVFKLEIPRERSHWRIEAPSQLYYPAIRGSIWVDKETSRVLRIEMEAHNLPTLFPFDTVEAATDYDFIRLAAAEQEYLLPADAEVLNCERGSTSCSRNRIEFHNYKKFEAATSITFDAK